MTHLTEPQLYDLLDTPGAAAENLHLDACPHCRAEFLALQSSITNLRLATTSFAEEAPLAAFRAPPAAPSRASFPRLLPASLAGAAVLFAASLALHHPRATPAPAAPTLSDDALLDGINRDLSSSIPPSLEPLAIHSIPTPTRQP